ncbi:hypothetical protein Wenmar_01230 [Wenxinia marina DSM 24838]|uniref:Uncharacterized protein n=1 Tax=Wenxinia marina DSM 24838 TaxID=1123501 RepID=A0A0D0PG22_9RHOB|nr:hypothetical protein Wenmar_01230 [Wenxinia marina DSM 24838]
MFEADRRRSTDPAGADEIERSSSQGAAPPAFQPIVGMTNSGSLRTPEGQRVVMVLSRV